MSELTFEALMDEALAAPMTGWSFRFLRGRSTAAPLPWNYAAVAAALAGDRPLLDLGTGGGEVLAGLPARPDRTVATENWAPNVPVAARRLRPLGIPVVHYQAAPANLAQDAGPGPADLPDRLPFRDGAFGLVLSRHEAFRASEVARVLGPGGHFVTQQVDLHDDDDYRAALGLAARPASGRQAAGSWLAGARGHFVTQQVDLHDDDDYRAALGLAGRPASGRQPAGSWLPAAREQVRAAGLAELRAERAVQQISYADVGALAWYLVRAVPWLVPEAGLAAARPALRRLHDQMREAPLTVRAHRFLLVARKA